MDAPLTWKSFTAQIIRQFCEEKGARTFRLAELYAFAEKALQLGFPHNHHSEAKLRQTLQFLRDDGILTFVDGRGTYTWRGAELLKGEVKTAAVPLIQNFKGAPHKREYLVEVYARNQGWVKSARKIYGTNCLCAGCSNSFVKENGAPYCEVHHIVPLCDGGEDAVWNLSILCAHHHRMAHFARKVERESLKAFLLDRTQNLLAAV